jgi:hypothetical protein
MGIEQMKQATLRHVGRFSMSTLLVGYPLEKNATSILLHLGITTLRLAEDKHAASTPHSHTHRFA